MKIFRREFLKSLAIAPLIATPLLAATAGDSKMYGLIAKITAAAGKRAELIHILVAGSANMPGCLSYIVAKDAADENAVWVSEVWESAASHDASLALPSIKNALAEARPLIFAFEKIAVTTPVGGAGFGRAASS